MTNEHEVEDWEADRPIHITSDVPIREVLEAELERLGEVPAATVTEALRRVMRDLPAIGKDMQAPPGQGGYRYRGIASITREVQPLLAKHGVVIVPFRVLDREVRDITVNGKPWTDERMTVLYRVYGPGGAEDFIEAMAPAIGRDNSDKGSNKCMTQAFKYVITQVLCIADEKDDGDAASYATDAPEAGVEPPEAEQLAWKNRVARIRELTHQLRERGIETTETSDEGEVTVLDRPVLVRSESGLVAAITNAQADDLIGYLVRALADTVQPAPEPPAPPEPPAGPAAPAEPPEAASGPPAPPQRTPGPREQAAQAALDRAKAKPLKEVKEVKTKDEVL